VFVALVFMLCLKQVCNVFEPGFSLYFKFETQCWA
jgi:hypothetical protein